MTGCLRSGSSWKRLLTLLASMGLAALSWKYVESPFRKRLVLKRRSHVFAFAAAAAAVILATGTSIYGVRGLPSRIPPLAQQYADQATNSCFTLKVGLKDALTGAFGELGVRDKHLPVKVLLWGDSHAMAIAPALDSLLKEHAARGVQATHSSTAPLIGFVSPYRYSLGKDSIPWSEAVVSFIRRERVSDVVLAAVWTSYIKAADAERAPDKFQRYLCDTIAVLRGAGARLWIVKDVPAHSFDVPRVLARTVFFGRDPGAVGSPLAEHLKHSRMEDIAFRDIDDRSVTVLDPTPFFVTPGGICRVTARGKALYRDQEHLTVAGAMFLKPLFEPIVEGFAHTSLASPATVLKSVTTRSSRDGDWSD